MKKLRIFVSILIISVSYLTGCNKPDPKINEVIFDVPDLLNKNIDQIMETYQKYPGQYKDSVVANGSVFKKDENSEYINWNPKEKNGSITFIYRKDGWELSIF